jgi:multidrug resistance efflux pump
MTRLSASTRPALPRLVRVAWILGLATLVTSLAGTVLMLRSHAADKSSAPSASSTAGGEQVVVCIGRADVERGLISLYPLQPGRVSKVLVNENALVSAGTPLLQMDDAFAANQLKAAELALEEAREQLVQARKAPELHRLEVSRQQDAIAAKKAELEANRLLADRALHLKSGGNASEEETRAAAKRVEALERSVHSEEEKLAELQLSDPELDIRRAERQVQDKQLQSEKAQLAMDECTLKAPLEGTVVRVLASPGEMLGPQPRQPAVLFCPSGPRLIRAEVEQEFAGHVSVGQSAVIEDDTGARGTWTGKVVRIADVYTHRRYLVQEPLLQHNDVQTLECIIELGPGQKLPRINQRVRVTLRNP